MLTIIEALFEAMEAAALLTSAVTKDARRRKAERGNICYFFSRYMETFYIFFI